MVFQLKWFFDVNLPIVCKRTSSWPRNLTTAFYGNGQGFFVFMKGHICFLILGGEFAELFYLASQMGFAFHLWAHSTYESSWSGVQTSCLFAFSRVQRPSRWCFTGELLQRCSCQKKANTVLGCINRGIESRSHEVFRIEIAWNSTAQPRIE